MMNCCLCEIKTKSPIIDGERHFCCHGCHAVFNILASRNQLADYKNTPTFQTAVRSGLISNPELLEQIKRNQITLSNHETEKLPLEILEMWCPSCAELIKWVLLHEKGIKNCVVDYTTDLASIEYSPRLISKEKIETIISSLGYSSSTLLLEERKAITFQLSLRFIIAAFFSMNIMMFSYPIYAGYFESDGYDHLFVWISFFSTLPVLFYSAWPILKRFYASLKTGFLGMETLVVIGTTAAFVLSLYNMSIGSTHVYFDSLTAIIAFVLLGKIIEAKAKFSAKESLIQLTRSVPKKGRKKFADGTSLFVTIKEIEIGDTLIAFTGEKIVLDGVVIEGEGTCDESLMTGESIPVLKRCGMNLLAGTIVTHGILTYTVTANADQTALHQILEMVEKDVGQKAIYTRAADPIVKFFVPFFILLAFITWATVGGEEGILRAISLLLISCPCAIGIAAPLAESQMLHAFAELGVIVRNRACLSLLGKETIFVFDKTGTITEGKFEVLSGLDTLEEKSILKGLTSCSNHPIALAIYNAIEEKAIPFDSLEQVIGYGIRGIIKDKIYLFGSSKFLNVSDGDSSETTVYFSANNHRFVLGDKIKEGAKELVLSLPKTILLSGDGEKTVERVAKACHFTTYKSRVSPLEKRDFIDSLRQKGEIVCMMGDGINDAPALTGAHIGISVVSASDISIQVSDILLTTEKLDVIQKMRSLAIKGRRIINQNLFWAFFYNFIGLGLACAGMLTPLFSTFAMVSSSLIVLFNSLRVKR